MTKLVLTLIDLKWPQKWHCCKFKNLKSGWNEIKTAVLTSINLVLKNIWPRMTPKILFLPQIAYKIIKNEFFWLWTYFFLSIAFFATAKKLLSFLCNWPSWTSINGMRSPFFILLIPMWWKNARSVWNKIIWHSKIIKNPPQFLSKVQLCPDRILSLKILPNSWKNSGQIRNCAAISEKWSNFEIKEEIFTLIVNSSK